MTDDVKPKAGDPWPQGFEGHRRAQALMGLRMTPAERLRWLEETMEALRRWQGRAAAGSRQGGSAGGPRR